jgi:hypothetical protein
MLQRLPNHLNDRTLDRRQVKPFLFSESHFTFSDSTNICIFMTFHDLRLLPALFRYVLGKPSAARGLVCTLKIGQWCGEISFVSAAVSEGEYYSKFPGGACISHY